MNTLYEIKTQDDLTKFANKFGFSVNIFGNERTCGISNPNMGEYAIFTFSNPFMLMVSDKGSGDWDDCYVIEDWDNVEFCLSQTLKITIKNGKVFLSKV